MRQLTLHQINQLYRIPFSSCQATSRSLPPRHCLTLRRDFARQHSLRVVAQARKSSLLMRELESVAAEAQDEDSDNALPAGAT